MANIKSQIKRNRQNEKRRLRNRTYRGAARTAVNQARTAIEEGVAETKETIMKAISMLDKAAEKGVLHTNNAARRKGRLMKRLAALNSVPAESNEITSAEDAKAKKTSDQKTAKK